MLERIEQVFQDVFDNDGLRLTPEFSPETFPEWDSLAQVKLMTALESEFGVKFSTDEVVEAASAGSIQSILAEKGIS
jgi:acyl carrier protein